MAVKIVNKYHVAEGSYIWCGRPSPVGNPWEMLNRSQEERDRVCDLYIPWFNEQMKTPTAAAHFVLDLVLQAEQGDVHLGCVCKQKNAEVRCHCDTIKRFIDKQLLIRKKGKIEL